MSEEKQKKTEVGQAKGRTTSLQAPLIIGIGASAGGLEALQQFFDYMPSHSGMSFVVIQHLSPDYKSLMADILAKHTQMSVFQAENRMTVRPDTVYLIPPKKYMTVRHNQLILSDYDTGTLNHPIDVFFTSLAEERKEHSIVVVLSGTGSDGTNGIITMGRPFTTFPTGLRFYYKYKTSKVNRVKVDRFEYMRNQNDSCHVYVALTTDKYVVRTAKGESFNRKDPSVIAYGEFASNQNQSTYKQVEIELEYYDLKKTPNYLIIVCSSSKYGDFFTGGDASEMWLDEMELVYE